jgi:hypothetical protein
MLSHYQRRSADLYRVKALGDGALADGVRLDMPSLHCTMDIGNIRGVGRRLGSPLVELDVMANDRRETTLNDVWRNPPERAKQADTEKSAELICRVAESH